MEGSELCAECDWCNKARVFVEGLTKLAHPAWDKNKDIDEFVYNIKKENNTDIYKLYLAYNKDYKIKLSDAIYQDKKYLYKLINLLKKELKQRKILN